MAWKKWIKGAFERGDGRKGIGNLNNHSSHFCIASTLAKSGNGVDGGEC